MFKGQLPPYVNFIVIQLIPNDTGILSIKKQRAILLSGSKSVTLSVGSQFPPLFLKINTLLLDEELRKHMCINALNSIKEYTIENMVKVHKNVIYKID